MANIVQEEVVSPDSRYVATFAVRGDLARSFEFLSLCPKRDWRHLGRYMPIPRDEVGESYHEFAISKVVWQDSNTVLAVTTDEGPDEDFAFRLYKWRDVNILWRSYNPILDDPAKSAPRPAQVSKSARETLGDRPR